MTKINWNDIPKYSPWVKVLLETKGVLHEKTSKEVWREYNDEKWKEVHERLTDPSITLDDLERDWRNEKSLGYIHDTGLIHESMGYFRERQLELYQEVLASYADKDVDLVELGAGYGSIFYPLWCKLKNIYHSGYAGEYADTGVNAMVELGKRETLSIGVGHCDFFKETRESVFEEIKNCVLFTSYALCCVSHLKDSILDYFISFHPRVVVHFEPCYEYFEEDSLYGLLCQKYIETNDYNKNMVSVLKQAEICGKIRIIEERQTVMGINAWLPISVIVWQPVEG